MNHPPPTHVDPRWLLALAWLAGFTLIDSSIVSLALPDMARDLDRSIGQVARIATGGAAMGVAIPAVAFELAASGSRAPNAALAGSTSAFAIRLGVLAIPLLLLLAMSRTRHQPVPAAEA